MKINKKDFPPLTVFLDKTPDIEIPPLKDCPEDALKKQIRDLSKLSKGNLFTVSDTIWQTVNNNCLKVMKEYLKEKHNDIFSGAFIDTKAPCADMLIYNIDFSNRNDKYDGRYSFAHIVGMKNLKKSVVVSIGYYDFKYHPENRTVTTCGFCHTPADSDDYCASDLIRLLELSIFLKYADIDVLTVYGKQKKYISNSKDYIDNQSGILVKYIDSRWLREIIRLEGFKVREHFRLQPIKDEQGEWTRKLIYINEFEKHGYHRRATRNLTDDINNDNKDKNK